MKIKKKVLFALIGIVVLIAIVYLVNRPKNYNIDYEVDGFEIYEQYRKELNMYYFKTLIDDKVFELAIKDKYLKENKLIEEVDSIKKDDVYCIMLKSSLLDTYPICYKGNESISYNLVSDESFVEFFKYEEPVYYKKNFLNISTDSLFGKSYAVWQGKGFIYFNEKLSDTLTFLEKESYYDNLSYSNGRYVIIPNYDELYEFGTFFILDLKTGKVKTWEIENKISYNSYYLGVHNEKIYMIDRKNKIEYELDPAKKSISIISKDNKGRIWSGKWVDVSMIKLINTDYEFITDTVFNYELIKNRLFLSYFKGETMTQISDLNVDSLVKVQDDIVFFLSTGSLYRYSPREGLNVVASYSEWNFTKENPIYIY